ncbi:MAG: hypothetical protein J7463_00305 [Roseiflexus sp.]|jgi:hypothetical protein|nr:hypothetical protein [Roseiflexus sp.]MBO9335609.1 hypothetical protein [Roseiflexus sp.]MBO9383745.1 hypothetical protein [Roseiflexus sp.]MBO9387497.1 hypothetical protein [Roseiflexus sp.]
MVRTEIKANQREAAQLFVRGVAAARGGQRRLAAVLLARVVQLDPQHEMGWLWLSGVLDDPKEIAFCLRSVLAINPQNERARRGLAWLESRQLLRDGDADITAPFARAVPNVAEESVSNGSDGVVAAPSPSLWRTRLIGFLFPAREPSRDHTDSWWVGWRLSRQEMSRARVLLWSMPILLLMFTLALNYALRAAVERNQALIQAELMQRAIAAGEELAPEEPVITVPALLETTLTEERNAATLAYLSRLEEPRARLRGAIESYRNATSRPGGSSIIHATSAQRLRDEIEQAYAVIAAVQPPDALAEAHALYLQGLELELTALDHMLAFYSSFRAEDANRAALAMAEAARRIDQARQAFDRQQTELSVETPLPHAAR